MTKKKLSRIISIFLLSSSFLCVYGQTAILFGKITSENDNEDLVGVNIILDGSIYGTISGIHGEYVLKDIPAGNRTIVFSSMGYTTRSVNLEFSEYSEVEYNVVMETGAIDLSSITIEARQPFSAASSKTARKFDLMLRPVRSAQDLLTVVPGLFIAQHAGGGKAEQLFMRGFDADHGTDIGVYVDGIPVNMVSHGHGQGYADLHFIIPEIIDALSVYKGPYFSKFGNFGTAGSVELSTTDHPDNNLVKLEGGMLNSRKLTSILKIPTNGKHQSAFIAGQYSYSDGPTTSPQGFNRVNLYGKFHTHLSPGSELGISINAFSSAWNASGQIPIRAVESGQISRWDAIDDMEGGITGRYNASIEYHFMEGYEHDFLIKAYYSKYDFKLFSNFTLWLNDPINGDMIEQNDHRSLYGINTRYSFKESLGNVLFFTKIGSSYRGDDIDLSLWHSPYRQRLQLRTNDRVQEVNMSAWIEEDIIFSSKFKIELGLRGDYFTFDVLDYLDYAAYPGNGLPHASGYAQAAIMSPKLNLVWKPIKQIDIYLNGGTGFHSNDARDVMLKSKVNEIIHAGEQKGLDRQQIQDQLSMAYMNIDDAEIEILPRAIGSEIGTRIAPAKWMVFNLAAWYLHMEEELVYVGDEGSTEINGETRRMGVDLEVRMQVARYLWADIDYNFADGRFINEPSNVNYIPLAPRSTAQGGVDLIHPSGFESSLRFRYLADRPANEEYTVTALGYFLANLMLGYTYKGIHFFGHLENLLNTEWNEAQFDTESRLFDETEPVSELHFTPGNPFNLQIGVSLEF